MIQYQCRFASQSSSTQIIRPHKSVKHTLFLLTSVPSASYFMTTTPHILLQTHTSIGVTKIASNTLISTFMYTRMKPQASDVSSAASPMHPQGTAIPPPIDRCVCSLVNRTHAYMYVCMYDPPNSASHPTTVGTIHTHPHRHLLCISIPIRDSEGVIPYPAVAQHACVVRIGVRV